MKKILLTSFEYPLAKAYSGGVGQVVRTCRNMLTDMGYEVYVLITSGFQKRHPVKLLLPDNSLVRYRNFWGFQKQYNWHYFNYIIQHFVNWTREFKKLKKHKGPRPKIIYHFHSILKREKDSGFKTFNQFLLNQERMIEIADKVICPSRYEYDNFMRYFPYFSGKVTLIENTVEHFPCREKEMENIRKRHGIKQDDIVAIYVGRLEKIKGADIIIKSIPKLLSKYKKFKVFIVGKTLERSLYKKLMRVKKRFPRQAFYINYLEKKLLFQYYYLSNVYINTSLSESFSLTSHENAFCSNALLLSSLPVLEKFQKSAIFFSNHTPDYSDFISKLKLLIKNRRLRERLARRSLKLSRRFHSQNRLKQDFSKLFQSFSTHTN